MHYINSNASDIVTPMEHAKICSHYNTVNTLRLFIQYYSQIFFF